MQTKHLVRADRAGEIAAKAAQTPRANGTVVDAEGNVDKIRDILFGGQMRDYERRFGELLTRMEAENTRLRQEVQERFTRLETFLRQELEAAAARMQRESRERNELIDALRKASEAADKTLAQKLAQHEELQAKQASELRNGMHERSEQLANKLNQAMQAQQAALQAEAKALREDKTGRQELSDLLSEFALRLSHDFKLPKAS